MTRLEPLPKLPDTLSQEEMITAWLNDMELYRIAQEQHGLLQNWGADHCEWQQPVPINPEFTTGGLY
jgi:hypothetical protein